MTTTSTAIGRERGACSLDDCDRPHYGHGLCQMHYKRSRRPSGLDGPVLQKDTKEYLRQLVSIETDACTLWGRSITASGYPLVQFDERAIVGHRLVCWDTYGPPPFDGAQAAHSCGVKRCVNPRHIRWATRQENEADKKRHGTYQYGERNPAVKLSDAQVAAIRRGYAEGVSRRTIAWYFGLSQGHVCNIINNKVRVPA